MNRTETRFYKKEIEPLLKEIGNYLKDCRNRAGVTQAYLAETSGIGAHMNIARYENGYARIPLENVEPLAKALKIDPIDLALKVLPTYGLSFLVPHIKQ
jgi:transcriptional regulator with XRE-family HTH domain